MKKVFLNCILLLCALIVGSGNLWADDPLYTLSFTKLTSGTNYSSYTGAHDITVSSKTWSVFGNQSVGANLRVGGKTTSNTDRTLTSKATISATKAIGKVVINHSGTGAGTNTTITINSIKVEGSTSSSFATSKSKTISNPSVASAGNLEFTLDDGNWDENSYFRITVNYVTAKIDASSSSGPNNSYITINNVKFYEATSSSTTFSVTYDGNGNTSGSIPTDATAYASGATVTVLDNIGSLAKTYCTFGGWNTKSDGTGTNYTAGNTFTISTNTTLYAKWTDTRSSAGLVWSAASADVTYGADNNVFPTLTNTHSVAVTYSSSNQAAATIDGSGGITYRGNSLLTIALNGSNSVSTTNAAGTVAFYLNGGTIKFIKATGANSAELTATCGSGGSPIDTNVSTLGSGLYWKPIARETMVITEDPNFVIIEGTAIADGSSINGTSGSITYNASDKILTLNGYEKDFGTRHAIKTGVSGLKVKLIGASTINCSADSAVFFAFSSSASIQFIKNDATSKLTMTGTAHYNFANVTYDGLFLYDDGNTTKYISQPAAPELSRVITNNYTYAKIDYAGSDKNNDVVMYSSANPVLKYSFDYADPQKQDVSNQTYPDGGIKMTDPGILTAWVEVSNLKSLESKGVRFGFIENPIEMEFDGTAKQISITPAPTMTTSEWNCRGLCRTG